jgi:ATP-dependent helicase/nuclease subunit B
VRASLFTIAPELPFLDTLVAGILAGSGSDPLALADHTILLPTRRACRSCREAFLRACGGRPLLLPRLMPVGDLDGDALALLADEGAGGSLDVAPAVPELRRQLMLTKLVLAFGRARGSGPATPGQAAPLAAALARFLDELETEGCDAARLAGLAPETLAAHWQEVLRFLDIVTDAWPRALAEAQCLDPAARRNKLLEAQAQLWQAAPPKGPVIAAGITGGAPAVAALVAAVAALPAGSVVLPGLDRGHDAASWDQIRADPTHPQHLMAGLLDRLGAGPGDVRDWPGAATRPSPRAGLLREALRPAAGSDRWRGMIGIDRGALAGITRLDCAGPREEALAIALHLRGALEIPGRTAALVTPDRALARRVAAELRRWGIEIDDSAGVPLDETPPGVFLRLLVAAVAEGFAPVPLLALLKHPLAAGGLEPAAFRDLARELEYAALRGPRPAPGLAGLKAAIPDARDDLRRFIDRLSRIFSALVAAAEAEEAALAALVAAHVAAAEALAASRDEEGAARMWREPPGEAAADFLSELLQAAADFPLAGRDYPALFEALLAGHVVRPPYGRHPRLAIWGLVEARLQQADVLVLGGLNEGSWPPATDGDPWLSRPMRQAVGMTPPERRVGVAAHDFAQAMGAREAVLTRATRVDGAPTVPSRWLLRLDTVLEAAKVEDSGWGSQNAVAWVAALDEPEQRILLPPPRPRPPIAARPRRLSVTQIETWRRDPYAIYARMILGLKPLDPLDADPTAADRGEFIHKALDDFVKHYPAALPQGAAAELIALGKTAFGAALDRPGVRSFWWPRFERIARWFVALEAARRAEVVDCFAERSGSLVLAAPRGPFELVAKADRIDRRRDGTLAIIDYKTGSVPQAGEVQLGYAPQLTLEAAIAEAGGFAEVAALPVGELAYWKLGGGDPAGEVRPVGRSDAERAALIAEARRGVEQLVAHFDDPGVPYRAVPLPERAPRFSDYAHLARVKEWSAGAEEDEE